MKKKSLIVVGVLVVLAVISVIVYKVLLIRNFQISDITSVKDSLQNIQELSIKVNKSLANIKFNDMNLNIPEGFNEKIDNIGTKVYVDQKNSTAVWLIETTPFPKVIDKDDINDKFGFNYDKLTKKYSIDREFDLLNYAKQHLNEKQSILWNKSHIQIDYLAKRYISELFITQETGKDIVILKEDLVGIKSQGTNFIQIYLINGDKAYIIKLNRNIFTSEEVTNLLNSIYFE